MKDFYLLTWVMTLLFIPLMVLTKNILGNETNKPDNSHWFTAIFIAPVLETFMVQFLVFKICNLFVFFRKRQVLVIFFSATIFGVLHTYNLGYMIFGFSIGIILAYVFYFYHKNTSNAFWNTVLIHCLRNLTAVILSLLF